MHCLWGTWLRRGPRSAWNPGDFFGEHYVQEELIASQAKGPFPNPRLPLGLVGRFLSSWQARERWQGYSLLRGIEQIILFGATEDALKQEELRNPPPEKRVRFQAAWRSLSSVVMGDVKPTGNGANHGGPSRKIGQGGVVHESKNRRSSGSAIPVSSLCILFLDACGAA